MAERPLLLIADASLGEAACDALAAVFEAVPGERVLVLERWKERDGPARPRLARLERLASLCRAHAAALAVSGRPDLALVVGADLVHLPERGHAPADLRRAFPTLPFGRSCHDRAGLERAQADGAAYALVSPLAAPHSKPLRGEALGVHGVASAIAGLALPIYALGGVTPAHAGPLRRVGAAGLAALGGVLGAPDPAAAARALLTAWDLPAAPSSERAPGAS